MEWILKWKDVKKEQPERDEEVLATDGFSYSVGTIFEIKRNGSAYFYCADCSGDSDNDIPVNYWARLQPLSSFQIEE